VREAILFAVAACASPSPLDDVHVRSPLPKMPELAGVQPIEGDLVLRDFKFSDGETIAELRVHYTTYGKLQRDAAGHATNAVLIMHGTTGSGAQFTRKQFVDELFGRGQLLDLDKYFVILPDDIGHGKSSKPSDGLHAHFPHYGYTDMVNAEHAIVEHVGVDHLRLVMGTSMGCMHTWMWVEMWPQMMDAALPLACLPTQIAGRNREWRKLTMDAITSDPAWQGGDYTEEPKMGLRAAAAPFIIAGSAPIADQKRMPTRDAADKATAESVERFIASEDANDLLYAVASSSDYDPSKDLDKITTRVTFVNSADDFINPPELGIAEQLIARVPHGRFVMIPASEKTHGHGTHTWAMFWKGELEGLLTPR
jgi:homoserine O-acetyltransferase/O-succinyltransferase